MANFKEHHNYFYLLSVLVPLGLGVLASGCASSSGAEPVHGLSARDRAHQIYEQLRHRTPRSDWSGGTASAFPEAPEGVVRPLEKLSASRSHIEEEAATLEVADALEATGYYSRVYFKSLPDGATIKYRPIARNRVVTAQAGWNRIAIGFYYVWAERQNMPSSPVGQYDIIAKSVQIVIREERTR